MMTKWVVRRLGVESYLTDSNHRAHVQERKSKMASRRPGTAATRRNGTVPPFLVLSLKAKPAHNPLLVTPSRPLLVPRRPSYLRLPSPLKSRADSSSSLTHREKSYTLLTATYGQTAIRTHTDTCAGEESEDSSVLVGTEDLEAIWKHEQGALKTVEKRVTLTQNASLPVLKRRYSKALHTPTLTKQPGVSPKLWLLLTPKQKKKLTPMPIITNTSFKSELDESRTKIHSISKKNSFKIMQKSLKIQKKQVIREKIDVYFPVKLSMLLN